MELSALLAQARQPLSPDVSVADEHVLIANTRRHVLRAAIAEAGPAAEMSQLTFAAASERLNTATQAYLAVTPVAEIIDPTESPSGSEEPAESSVIGLDELRELLPGVDDDSSPLDALFVDNDNVLAKRSELEQASLAYTSARQERNAKRAQLDLANRVGREARRLSKVPQLIVAVLGSILFGGLAVQVDHTIQEQARTVIASGTVAHNTSRYRALENLASNAQTDLLDGISVLGGIVLSSGVAWFGMRDRPARLRAMLIIKAAEARAHPPNPVEKN